MTDLIALPRGKISVPIHTERTLEPYGYAERDVPRRQDSMEQTWLDDA